MKRLFTCNKSTFESNMQETVAKFIKKHADIVAEYQTLQNYYLGKHAILEVKKDDGKPNAKIVVNKAKYIVDTFNGYAFSKPIKQTHEDEVIAEFITQFNERNDQDDNNAELAKLTSIFGHAFELLYTNEYSEVCTTYEAPIGCFIVYDDTVQQNPLFAVRILKDDEDKTIGTIYTTDEIIQFTGDDVSLGEPENHFFGDVPVIEYLENAERMGAYETVISMIDAYNETISEKSNDVAYFAENFLKILGGQPLEQKDLVNMRQSRVINIAQTSPDAPKIEVDFLNRPSSDGTQENLLNRLEREIFAVSMVSNISDESFGNASGVALKFKLQSMENLALMKERKFQSAMLQKWRMVFSVPNVVSASDTDKYKGIKYIFTRNIPNNLADEATTAKNLVGIVSNETVLSTLSVVKDVKQELNTLESEKEKNVPSFGFGGEVDEQQ